MSWQRTKATTTELLPAPSLTRWILTGVLALILGALLFILHVTGTVPVLAAYNIWGVSLAPPVLWLLFFCLRGWQRGREVNEYAFLQKEAARAQTQWEAWAGRYIAIAGSCLLLPDSITAGCLYENMPQHYRLARRIDYLSPGSAPEESVPGLLLKNVADALRQLPVDLPLRVTLISDDRHTDQARYFTDAWQAVLPGRAVPADVTVNGAFSLSYVEERLKQPSLTVDLILVMQLHGGHAYSDGLAVLMLTSDDVAQKYGIAHPARLLRPMSLNMSQLPAELELFLETQTVARQSARIFCDDGAWHDHFADLLTTGAAHQARWRPEEIAVLEKWIGIPGPASGWLLLALLAGTVNLRNTSVLGLFSSDTDHFVSTITPGSEKQ